MADLSMKAINVLNYGQVSGKILKLDEPLSFWGGFNPRDGCIIDQSHPQVGESINKTILALPGTKGSAGTPGAVTEAIRLGVGPAAILLPKPDVNLLTGVLVAAQLYKIVIPVLILLSNDFDKLETGRLIHIKNELIYSV